MDLNFSLRYRKIYFFYSELYFLKMLPLRFTKYIVLRYVQTFETLAIYILLKYLDRLYDSVMCLKSTFILL